jgi:ankyrin repeat protein
MLLNKRLNPNVQEKDSFKTPIHYAVSALCNAKNYEEYIKALTIVKILLNSDANLNLLSNVGEGPIHYAIKSDQVELVELLLLFGAKFTNADTQNLIFQGVVISPFLLQLLNSYYKVA